jgi:stage III sporulation protein AG
MITYEGTPEKVPAVNKDTQASQTNDDTNGGNREQSSQRSTDSTVTVQSGGVTEPLIVTQKRPKVIGVIVVAQGAYDFNVRMDIINAVHTALNVPVSIIDVFAMEQGS